MTSPTGDAVTAMTDALQFADLTNSTATRDDHGLVYVRLVGEDAKTFSRLLFEQEDALLPMDLRELGVRCQAGSVMPGHSTLRLTDEHAHRLARIVHTNRVMDRALETLERNHGD
jgi:hypothetical protein